VKKVITFNASDKDSTPDDIVIKLRPEKYNPMEEITINANFINLGCIMILGVINY
jgi:hypothetical protein